MAEPHGRDRWSLGAQVGRRQVEAVWEYGTNKDLSKKLRLVAVARGVPFLAAGAFLVVVGVGSVRTGDMGGVVGIVGGSGFAGLALWSVLFQDAWTVTVNPDGGVTFASLRRQKRVLAKEVTRIVRTEMAQGRIARVPMRWGFYKPGEPENWRLAQLRIVYGNDVSNFEAPADALERLFSDLMSLNPGIEVSVHKAYPD